MSSKFTVYVGTKTYSSWSLRGWLGARVALGRTFEEVKVYLAGDGAPPDAYQRNKEALMQISPTGKVPALVDHELGENVLIYDSFAILLHLGDRFPQSGLLPTDPIARGLCYSACAEMHSGFQAMRSNWTHHCLATARSHGELTLATKPDLRDDINRLITLWTSLRTRFGQGGRFLFGEQFSAADCMYAPVALRFRTYDPDLSTLAEAPVAAEYVRALWNNEHVIDWMEDAKLEGPELKIAQYELYVDK